MDWWVSFPTHGGISPTDVSIVSSGHWTVIIWFFDCPIAEAAVLAMDDEPPAVTEPETVALIEPSAPPPDAFTSTDAEAVAVAENCDAVSLVVDSLYLLLNPVSILMEAPCVLLATRRQKPRMVLSTATFCGN